MATNFTRQDWESFAAKGSQNWDDVLLPDLRSAMSSHGYETEQSQLDLIGQITGESFTSFPSLGQYFQKGLTHFFNSRSGGAFPVSSPGIPKPATTTPPPPPVKDYSYIDNMDFSDFITEGASSQAGHAAAGNTINPGAYAQAKNYNPAQGSGAENFIDALNENGIDARLSKNGRSLLIKNGQQMHRIGFDYASEKFGTGLYDKADFPILNRQVYGWGVGLSADDNFFGMPIVKGQPESPTMMAIRHIKTALESDDFEGTLREMQKPLRTLTEQPRYQDINNKALRYQLATTVLVHDAVGNTPAFNQRARAYGNFNKLLESQSSEGGSNGASLYYRPNYLATVPGVTQSADGGVSVQKASTAEKEFKFAKTLRAREFYPVDPRFSGAGGIAGFNQGTDGDAITVALGGRQTGGGRAIASTSFYNSVGLTAFRDTFLPIHGSADLSKLQISLGNPTMEDATGSYRAQHGQSAMRVATIGDEAFDIKGSSFQGTVIRGNPRLSVGYGPEAVNLVRSLGFGSEADLFRQMMIDPSMQGSRDSAIQKIQAELAARGVNIPVEFGGNNQGDTSLVLETARMVQGLGVKSDGSKVATAFDASRSHVLDSLGVAMSAASSDVFKVPDPNRVIEGLMRTNDPRFSGVRSTYLQESANADIGQLQAAKNLMGTLQSEGFGIDFYRQGFEAIDGIDKKAAMRMASEAFRDYGSPVPLAYSGHTVEYSASRHMGMPLDVFKSMENAYPRLANDLQEHEIFGGINNPYRNLVDSMTNAPAEELQRPEAGFGLNWQWDSSPATTRRALTDLERKIGDKNFQIGGVTMMSPKAMAYFADQGAQSRYMEAVTAGSEEQRQMAAMKYQNYIIDKYAEADEIKKGASSLQSLPGMFDRYVRGPEDQDPNSIIVGKPIVQQMAKDAGLSYKEMLRAVKSGEVFSSAVRIPLVGANAPAIMKVGFDRNVAGYQVPSTFEIAYQGDNDRDPATMFVLGRNNNGNYVGFDSAKQAYQDFVAGGGTKRQALQALYAAGGRDAFEAHQAGLRGRGVTEAQLNDVMLFGDKKQGIEAFAPMIGKAAANPWVDAEEDAAKEPLGPIMKALNGDKSQVNGYQLSQKFANQAMGKLEMGIYNFLRSVEEGGSENRAEINKAFPGFGAAVGTSAADMVNMNFRMIGYQPALDQSGLNAALRDTFTKFNTETARDPSTLAAQIMDTMRMSGFQNETIASLGGVDSDDMRRIYDQLEAGERPTLKPGGSALVRASAAKIASNIESYTEFQDGKYVDRRGRKIDVEELNKLRDIAGPKTMAAMRTINRRHYDVQEFTQGVDAQVSYSSGLRDGGTQDLRAIHAANTARMEALGGGPPGEEFPAGNQPPDDGWFGASDGPPAGGSGGDGGGTGTRTAAAAADPGDFKGQMKVMTDAITDVMKEGLHKFSVAITSSGNSGVKADSTTKMALGSPFQPGGDAMSWVVGKLFNEDGTPTGQTLEKMDWQALKPEMQKLGRFERSAISRLSALAGGTLRPGEYEDLRKNLLTHSTRRDLDTPEGVQTANTLRAISQNLPSPEQVRENRHQEKLNKVSEAFPDAMKSFKETVDKARESLSGYSEMVKKASESQASAKEVYDSLASTAESLKNPEKFYRAAGLGRERSEAGALRAAIGTTLSGDDELGKVLQDKGVIGVDQQAAASQARFGRLMSGALMFQLARDLRYTVAPVANAGRQGIAAGAESAAGMNNAGIFGGNIADSSGYRGMVNMEMATNAFNKQAGAMVSGYYGASSAAVGLAQGPLGAAYAMGSPAIGATFATAMIGNALTQANPKSALGGFLGKAAVPIGLGVLGMNAIAYGAGAVNDTSSRQAGRAEMLSRGYLERVGAVFTGEIPFNEFVGDALRRAWQGFGSDMNLKDEYVADDIAGSAASEFAKDPYSMDIRNLSPSTRKTAMTLAMRKGRPIGNKLAELGLSEAFGKQAFNESYMYAPGRGFGVDQVRREQINNAILNATGAGVNWENVKAVELANAQAFGNNDPFALGSAVDIANNNPSTLPIYMRDKSIKTANAMNMGGTARVQSWVRSGRYKSYDDAMRAFDKMTDGPALNDKELFYRNEYDKLYGMSMEGVMSGTFDDVNASMADLIASGAGLTSDDYQKAGVSEARSFGEQGKQALLSAGIFKSDAKAGAYAYSRAFAVKGGRISLGDKGRLALQQEFGMMARMPQLQALGFISKDNDKALGQIAGMFSGGPMSAFASQAVDRFMSGDPSMITRANFEYYQSGGQSGALIGPGGGAGGSGLLMDSVNNRGRFDVSLAMLNEKTAAMPLSTMTGPSGTTYQQPSGPAYRAEIMNFARTNSQRMSSGSINTWNTVGGGFQNRMVDAASGKSFGIGGIAGLNILSSQVSYEAAAASAGIAAAEIRAQHDFQVNVERPQAHMKFDMDVAKWYGGTVNTGYKDLKTGENITIDYGAGEKAWRRKQIAMERESAAAGFNQSMTRLGWQMEDVNREAGRYGVQVGWQRDDFALQGQRIAAQRQFQNYENAFSMQSLSLNRRYANEDFAYGKMMNQRQFGFQMEDYDIAIRRSSGFERKQLIKQRDRDTDTYQIETNHQDQMKKRQDEQFKREEDHLKKQIEHTKQMQKFEDEEFRRKKTRFDQEVKWKEEDFNIRRGRISQEMGWAEENFARQEAARKMNEERMEAEEKSKEALMSMESDHMGKKEALEDKLYQLSLARVGVAAGEAAKQLEIQKLVEGLKEKQEAAIKKFEGWWDTAAYKFVQAIFKYVGEQMPSPPTQNTNDPGEGDKSNRKHGGETGDNVHDNAFRENSYVSSGSSSRKGSSTVVIKLDSKVLAEATFDQLAELAGRSGRRNIR